MFGEGGRMGFYVSAAISLTFLSVLLFDSLDGSDKCQRCHWIWFNYTRVLQAFLAELN